MLGGVGRRAGQRFEQSATDQDGHVVRGEAEEHRCLADIEPGGHGFEVDELETFRTPGSDHRLVLLLVAAKRALERSITSVT